MFRNRDLILAVIIYGMASLCQISFDSIYPLTLMNSRKYGGFEMNAVEEGWVATSAIVLQLTSSTDPRFSVDLVLIFPLWSKVASYRYQIVLCLLVMSGIMLVEPAVSIFNESPLACQFAMTYIGYAIRFPFELLFTSNRFFFPSISIVCASCSSPIAPIRSSAGQEWVWGSSSPLFRGLL